jgi:hypothetical protein
MLFVSRNDYFPGDIALPREYLELPEAAGREVSTLRVYDDPPSGREVHIIFADGTAISIDLTVRTAIEAKHYRGKNGDLEILNAHAG